MRQLLAVELRVIEGDRLRGKGHLRDFPERLSDHATIQGFPPCQLGIETVKVMCGGDLDWKRWCCPDPRSVAITRANRQDAENFRDSIALQRHLPPHTTCGAIAALATLCTARTGWSDAGYTRARFSRRSTRACITFPQ